ncbi:MULTISPECIES: sensor histidine kinase [unclassified Streptomyces]|uniref:sensor histidine kinase n=1 Tax=unclassified Streptomyces TaxID=2593676 RepID=UPI0007101BDD|nr:histidine kinase [Streptomyces sp. Root264]KRD24606.1 histidine kinase [Streptomyces sp. Root264]
MTVINRDPRTAPHRTRTDALLAAATALFATAVALAGDEGRPHALGWTLLLAGHVPLVWRRRAPLTALLVVVACIVPYHVLDYDHDAPLAATMVALYTVAASGTARRTLLTGAAVLGVTLVANALTNPDGVLEVLRISGWVIAVLFCGMSARFYRQYVAAIVERAERAERTRDEEARRRVAEERLRIARDLHDLLAHTITLVGVQTSVAAHVLTADPERLDRAAVAKALDDIAETCRSARAEIRTTLEVLRENGALDARGPLPGLHGLADLVETARAAGAQVDLSVQVTSPQTPPSVGAAVYRIVQEALTNAVRHGGRHGAPVGVRVRVYETRGAVRVEITDDGAGGAGTADSGTPVAGTGAAGLGTGTAGVGTGTTGLGTGAACAGVRSAGPNAAAPSVATGADARVAPGVDTGVDRSGADDDARGFGLVGMRERARSVGGTLTAGPRDDGRGFAVSAVLPTGESR